MIIFSTNLETNKEMGEEPEENVALICLWEEVEEMRTSILGQRRQPPRQSEMGGIKEYFPEIFPINSVRRNMSPLLQDNVRGLKLLKVTTIPT